MAVAGLGMVVSPIMGAEGDRQPAEQPAPKADDAGPKAAPQAAPQKEPAKPGGAAPPEKPAEGAPKQPPPPAEAPPPVNMFERVTERAKALAGQPYKAPTVRIPEVLTRLSYDQYRRIRFRPEQALWNGEALFEVQLFHPGFLYRLPVTIHLVEDGQVRTVPFDANLFNYDGLELKLPEQHLQDIGYAGFRLHYPLNTPAYKDEVIVFLGASYFRLLGRGQVYGISARGLAVDTATPEGEEFPRFSEFWLIKPAPGATSMTVYALLESESLTGAYRFDLHPGEATALDVTARLFARADVAKLGIAPLTSMFLYGENKVQFHDDYRPEVHDSDGLLMHTGSGEWIWRPLTNPRGLHVSSLLDRNPHGFGLLQRDREFDNYLDIGALYHRRPSYWVEPIGDWGEGVVELVEIPSQQEINDNIVAFWVPKDPFRAGESLTLRYRLWSYGDGGLASHRLGQVERVHIGWGAVPGRQEQPPRRVRRFVVDFKGGALASLVEAQPVEVRLRNSSGKVTELIAQHLPNGGWRASFMLQPEGQTPSDMRLFLELRGDRITETWSFVWYPNAIE